MTNKKIMKPFELRQIIREEISQFSKNRFIKPIRENQNPSKVFMPKWASIDREKIAELISVELSEGSDYELITPDDERLTDKLCQDIVDCWNTGGVFDENIEGQYLWEDDESISPFWLRKFKKIFNS